MSFFILLYARFSYQLNLLSHMMDCLEWVFDVVGMVEVEEELKAFQLVHRQYLDVQQFLSAFFDKKWQSK